MVVVSLREPPGPLGRRL